VSIRQLLEMLIEQAEIDVDIQNDPTRMRPSDIACLYGNNKKIEADVGWQPEIALATSLQDVLYEWLSHLIEAQ
jgi:GDP-4-dehydro-6-deoxy-D-mannose reductase